MSLEQVPTRPVEVTAPQRNDWIELMKPAAELATAIAATEFVPAELRNRPEAIAAAILFGAELGIGPMVALAKIAVVKGRPAPSAELGRALALAAGHELWFDDVSNTRVVACGRRRGSSHMFTVAWSMDDARRAGIAGSPSWAKYPRQMLVARATAELVRQMAPDVLGGITVFAEEAVDIDDNAPATPPTAPTTPPEPTRKRRRTQTTPKPKSTPTAPPAPPSDDHEGNDERHGEDDQHPDGDDQADDDDRPTTAQRDLAMARFAAGGIDNRADRLHATSAFVGRPVASWNELTRGEASTVIDALEHLAAGTLTLTIDDDGTWHAVAVDDPDLDE